MTYDSAVIHMIYRFLLEIVLRILDISCMSYARSWHDATCDWLCTHAHNLAALCIFYDWRLFSHICMQCLHVLFLHAHICTILDLCSPAFYVCLSIRSGVNGRNTMFRIFEKWDKFPYNICSFFWMDGPKYFFQNFEKSVTFLQKYVFVSPKARSGTVSWVPR